MSKRTLSRQQFLANLRKSGLFSPAELEQLSRVLPESAQGRDLANALIRAGKLTRYQAAQLLTRRPKRLVFGQYKILRRRGVGALGKVYKAVHETMNRVVALKVLSPRVMKTERARELFQREVVAAGRLAHPNIATAFDASTAGDRHYLVMEYVTGPDLDSLVRARGPLAPAVGCEMIRQAALGLQHAHDIGMLHRDIKPANILLQRGTPGSASPWTVKLVDFGLAKLQIAPGPRPVGLGTILTRDNTVMGTPDYLSPEQSRDLHHVDIRSDLYSLGCTLYFLLTGRVPFPGGTSLEKMIRHASEEPTPVEKLRPEIPSAVAQVVHKLMAKKPEDRFQTPAELVQALMPLASARAPSNLRKRPRVGAARRKTRSAAKRKLKKSPETDPAAAATHAPIMPPAVNEPLPPPAAAGPSAGPLAGAVPNAGPSVLGLVVAVALAILIITVAMVLSLM